MYTWQQVAWNKHKHPRLEPLQYLPEQTASVTLQQHDHHIAHRKHLVQCHLQVCDPSLFILSKAIKFLIDTFNKIDVTQVKI